MKFNVRNKIVMLFAITAVVMVVFGLALGKKQQVSVTEQHTRDFLSFRLRVYLCL